MKIYMNKFIKYIINSDNKHEEFNKCVFEKKNHQKSLLKLYQATSKGHKKSFLLVFFHYLINRSCCYQKIYAIMLHLINDLLTDESQIIWELYIYLYDI